MSEVDVSGRAPKIFMSRAESHEVGGEGSVFSELVGGEGTSQENGEVGGGEGLSLRVMVRVAIDRWANSSSQARDHMVIVIVKWPLVQWTSILHILE
jgi:hypothetical protein